MKHFTKFTKDIFASLICLIFIYEAMLKIFKVISDLKNVKDAAKILSDSNSTATKLSSAESCLHTEKTEKNVS